MISILLRVFLMFWFLYEQELKEKRHKDAKKKAKKMQKDIKKSSKAHKKNMLAYDKAHRLTKAERKALKKEEKAAKKAYKAERKRRKKAGLPMTSSDEEDMVAKIMNRDVWDGVEATGLTLQVQKRPS